MTKQVQLQAVIDGLIAEVADVQAAVVASRDGLSMAATIGGGEGSRVAAMAATVHAVGNRVASTTDLGTIEETVIRGDEMTFVVYDAGEPAVLALLAPGDCNLGMIHLEGRRAAGIVGQLLTEVHDAPPPPPPAPPAAVTSGVTSSPASPTITAPTPSPTSAAASTSVSATPSPSPYRPAVAAAASTNGATRGDHERDTETTTS